MLCCGRICLVVLGLAACKHPADSPDGGPPPDGPDGPHWIDRCDALAGMYAAPAVPGTPLRTLYVDGSTGDDTRTGTSAADAWKTLGKANSSVRAGDLVLVSGSFTNEQIAPAASGTATDRIVYRAADANQLPTLATNATAISLVSRSYIVIDGLDVQQSGGDAIYMSSANNDWIRNVKFHTAGTSRIWTSSDNRIEDCTFDTAASPLMYARDGDNRNVFARNAFLNATVSFGMGDNTAAPSRDNVFFANDFVNHRGGSIDLTGLAENTLFECNSIHESGIDKTAGMQGPDQPEAGAGPALTLSASNETIRYNRFYANKWEVIRLQAIGDCTNATSVHDVNDNLIQQNVFYDNGGPNVRIMNSGPGPSGCGGATPLWADTKGNRIENNLYWKGSEFCDFHFCDVPQNTIYAVVFGFYHTEQNNWPTGATGLNGNIIRNNFIGRDTATAGTDWMKWEGYTYPGTHAYTLAEAEAKFPGEITGNSELDPIYRDPDAASFEPMPGSPAIDFGAPLDGMTFEGAAPDPGRYELVPMTMP